MTQVDQGQLFDPEKVTMRQASPVGSLSAAARQIAETHGHEWDDRSFANTTVKGPEGYAMYRTYSRNMGEAPTGETLKSYEALREHVGKQFDFLTRPKDQGGAGINVEVTAEDPYGSFEEMHADVTKNSRLKVMSTATTGSHHFFTDEENDRFRAVHDAFGHLATGRGFSRHGEEAAFLSHRTMLPKEAHAALASETRGQNSYLNWGGNEFPDNAPVNLPDWMTGDVAAPPARKPKIQKATQGTLF